MERSTRETLLSLTVVTLFVAGVALIVSGGLTNGVVGLVLVILSVIAFFPRVKDALVAQGGPGGERP